MSEEAVSTLLILFFVLSSQIGQVSEESISSAVSRVNSNVILDIKQAVMM